MPIAFYCCRTSLLLLFFVASCVDLFHLSSNASQVQFIFSGETKLQTKAANFKNFNKTTQPNITSTKTNIRRDANINLEQFNLDNNQQNVHQLVNTIDAHLRNLRKEELCVTIIQEIFDSVQFNNDPTNEARYNNKTKISLQKDLQIFSKRLEQKLQKAKHVILNLRDFFRYNVTRLIQQRLAQKSQTTQQQQQIKVDKTLSLEDNMDNDYDMDELDNLNEFSKLYLNTFIQATSEQEDKTDFGVQYNKQQMQILNFDKSDEIDEQFPNNFLSSNGELSLEINAFIAEKMEHVRQELVRTSEIYELNSNKNRGIHKEQKNMKFQGSHLKHIYFLSPSDHVTDRGDAYYDDTYFRQLYVTAIQHKFVILLIDVGSAMNTNQLDLMRTFVYNLLQLLTETDMLQLITVADAAQTMLLEDAQPLQKDANAYLTTRSHKEDILSYISKLEITKNATNHTLAFEYAFHQLKMLQQKSLINIETPITFIYLTRGQLTNVTDAKHVLKVIADGQRTLIEPIRLNICALLDEKSMMHEKQFLSDIAAQDYSKYNIETNWQHSSVAGKFVVLTKTPSDVVMRTAVAIFEMFFTSPYLAQNLQIHPAIIDADTRDNIVSITQAIAPFGVVGANLYLSDIVEDIVDYRFRFPRGIDVYAFLIDNRGRTLSHPSFPRPFARTQNYYPVDISLLENSTNFKDIRQRILSDTATGNATTNVFVNKLHTSEVSSSIY